jgi:hypothetical protein
MEFRDGWFLPISGCIEKFPHGFDKKVSRRFKRKRNADSIFKGSGIKLINNNC